MAMLHYTSQWAAVMICVTLVNTQAYTHRQLLTNYNYTIISSASATANRSNVLTQFCKQDYCISACHSAVN